MPNTSITDIGAFQHGGEPGSDPNESIVDIGAFQAEAPGANVTGSAAFTIPIQAMAASGQVNPPSGDAAFTIPIQTMAATGIVTNTIDVFNKTLIARNLINALWARHF